MSRRFLVAAAAAAFACAASVHAADKVGSTVDAHGVTVQVGAEYSGIAYPEPVQIDIHNDPVGREWFPGDPIREIPRQHWADPAVLAAQQRDPVNPPSADWLGDLQREYDAAAGARGASGFTSPILNFEGAPGTTFPSDPSGDVGADHYVQAVNASGGTRVRVFQKTDGAMVGNFILTSTLAGTGACSSGAGDPVVVYDGLAERWVITEFSPQSGRSLCFYISSTSDATDTTPGAWLKYTFTMPSFPDYPKYGIWSDAYYATANESGTGGARPVYAFERDQMLAGDPARFVRLTTPTLAGFGFQQLQPAHHLGGTDAPPPASAPGIFMRHRDDESHNAGSNNPTQDFLQLWQLTMDWSQTPTPGATLVGPVDIPITEFNSRMNGLSAFEAFAQPNGQRLDPLREPVMNQLQYRNFGTHESIVGNLTTNLNVDPSVHGAVRWFELRRTGGIGNPWTLFNEGTFAPDDGANPVHRWMTGSAMDVDGNIALAYSVTRQSPAVHPGLRYVGRLASDPAGVMTTGETSLIEGIRSQSGFNRWGDYQHMSVDPVDGCTFWFTGMHLGLNGSTTHTQVASFRHEECGGPSFTLSTSEPPAQVCVVPSPLALDGITVTIGSVNGFVDPVDLAFNPALPAGFSGGFDDTQLIPPDSTMLDLVIDGTTVAPGTNSVVIEATSGAIVKTRELEFDVFTAAPAQVALSAPADGAENVFTAPTLSWNAVAQAGEYLVEVATDPGFSDIVFSQVVGGGGTSVVTTALDTNTDYFWRVTAGNACGDSTVSEVFSFTTLPAPGDCADGLSPLNVFSEDFTGGANGFTTTGSTGGSWSLSSARPSPLSGGNAFLAVDLAAVSDQRLISPSIALPVGQLPITLKYQNWRLIEPNGAAGCFDGGLLEISVDGGAFTQITGPALLNDGYRGPLSTSWGNPLGGTNAWCDDPARAYADTLVDLSAHAGSSVQLRWRMATDSSVGREGWYVDDVRVESCGIPTDDADLSVTKTVDVAAPAFGDEVEFTIAVGNAGPLVDTGVVVTDLLPDGYSYVSHSTGFGTYDPLTGEWNIGAVPVGSIRILRIQADVVAGTDYENTASVAGVLNDPVPANNSASASTAPVGTSDLSIDVSVDSAAPQVGDDVVFTLVAANAGPDDSTGVEVLTLLPDGYAFVSADASTGTYDEIAGVWTIGTLAASSSQTLTITATVQVGTDYSTIATISGDSTDPVEENDADAAGSAPEGLEDIFSDGFEDPIPE